MDVRCGHGIRGRIRHLHQRGDEAVSRLWSNRYRQNSRERPGTPATINVRFANRVLLLLCMFEFGAKIDCNRDIDASLRYLRAPDYRPGPPDAIHADAVSSPVSCIH